MNSNGQLVCDFCGATSQDVFRATEAGWNWFTGFRQNTFHACTRVEVINFLHGKGRVYTFGPIAHALVELSVQDDGRTIKVIIDKRPVGGRS